ncbi:hypothetical protein TREES_T100009665 [Tupaia chinensis]|uniref:Uncharacterized protein n=1 Tax=Tupaia chinensis TaxID=246437 RepID=L9LCU4_TUPCH|nr:hypothetical protein TREES_T100009665 [Tupaia chinensis]
MGPPSYGTSTLEPFCFRLVVLPKKRGKENTKQVEKMENKEPDGRLESDQIGPTARSVPPTDVMAIAGFALLSAIAGDKGPVFHIATAPYAEARYLKKVGKFPD